MILFFLYAAINHSDNFVQGGDQCGEVKVDGMSNSVIDVICKFQEVFTLPEMYDGTPKVNFSYPGIGSKHQYYLLCR